MIVSLQLLVLVSPMSEFDLNEPDVEDLTDQQLRDWYALVTASAERYAAEIRRRTPVSRCPECGSKPREHEPWCYVGHGKQATPRPASI